MSVFENVAFIHLGGETSVSTGIVFIEKSILSSSKTRTRSYSFRKSCSCQRKNPSRPQNTNMGISASKIKEELLLCAERAKNAEDKTTTHPFKENEFLESLLIAPCIKSKCLCLFSWVIAKLRLQVYRQYFYTSPGCYFLILRQGLQALTDFECSAACRA